MKNRYRSQKEQLTKFILLNFNTANQKVFLNNLYSRIEFLVVLTGLLFGSIWSLVFELSLHCLSDFESDPSGDALEYL